MSDQNDPPPQAMPSDKAAKFRALFFEEAADLLQDAEQCLQKNAEGSTNDPEVAATLFRSVHSIKSGAASFGMKRVVALAHIFESALEELRRGSYVLDNLRRHMFIRGYDMIAKLLAAEAGQQPLPEGAEADLIKALEGLSRAASAVRTDTEQHSVPEVKLAPVLGGNNSIRIELSKIDRLVNLASELTILESMLRQRTELLLIAAGETGAEGENLLLGLDQLATQLRDLHHATMGARAQPLETVFQRLPRLVRELGDSLGKPVELFMSGSEVEVDKTITEQLGEPLVHILRNAIDHGIEPGAVRQEQGKPLKGTIRIEARCIESRLIMTIRDDGRGLNMQALRAKAEALGLDASDDIAVADLIFRPGLSTAEQVSEISGRGVGLDVVRHNLGELGGTIFVTSTAGEGTCFTLSLPLTLAIMDGMTVTIGDELYVLPLADVQEALHVPPQAIIVRRGMPPLVRHNDRYIPLVDPALLLGRPVALNETDNQDGALIAVIGNDTASVGLPISNIMGQQQIAIRAVHLNNDAKRPGATILGDGRVALILTATQIMMALRQPVVAA